MRLQWQMLPLALIGLAVTIGAYRYAQAGQPPPLFREFYRPHWAWERNQPIIRGFRSVLNWTGIAIGASVTVVLFLGFLGLF